MIMEYWRDDDWGKPHDVEKIQSEYHFVQEKFQIEWPVAQLGQP